MAKTATIKGNLQSYSGKELVKIKRAGFKAKQGRK